MLGVRNLFSHGMGYAIGARGRKRSDPETGRGGREAGSREQGATVENELIVTDKCQVSGLYGKEHLGDLCGLKRQRWSLAEYYNAGKACATQVLIQVAQIFRSLDYSSS